MGQKCKQKASLLICIWKILIFLLWIHIVGPYRLFGNNILICGGNMWVAATQIPLGGIFSNDLTIDLNHM